MAELSDFQTMRTWRVSALANPAAFMRLSGKLLPWLIAITLIVFAVGLAMAFRAPPDYQQGETVKIMYVHVPAAWLSMACYSVIVLSSAGYLIWRHPLADVSAKAAAPIGATFTLLALVTGSFWGKPMWGAYWVWDARLTSVLILFFLYLGLIALRSSIEEETTAAKLTAVLALVGVVILPFIKISVEGLQVSALGINIPAWNTLHQPSSVLKPGGPAIHPSILVPLLWSAAGFSVLFFAMHMQAMRNEITRRRVKAMQIAEVE